MKTNSFAQQVEKSLPQNSVDPMARVEPLVKYVAHCLAQPDPAPRAGDHEFEYAREALIALLQIAFDLNDLDLWTDSDLPKHYWNGHLERDIKARASQLDTMIKRLRRKACICHDFGAAMDLFEYALRDMSDTFSLAVITDPIKKGYSIERYRCASMLNPTLALVTEWWPLRQPGRSR